jgi:hypothetical protein
LLIGTHGIGKSTVVKNIAEQIGIKFKYYSSSTLDPFAELIGIPVPDKEKKVVDFYRPHDIDEAEFVFFDELNRVTNPRVLNTVLEIIQFKSINGTPLKNLKMVWAAINPPGDDYQVEDLDPALVDRFHMYFTMVPTIDVEYMKQYMSEPIARAVKEWWEDDLDKHQQKILTPRRIEYIGTFIDKGIPWKDAIPMGHTFPVEGLDTRIGIIKSEIVDKIVLNKDYILNNVESLCTEIKSNPKISIKLAEIIKRFNDSDMFTCRDLIESLPKELIKKIGGRKFVMWKRKLGSLFDEANIDIKAYPRIVECFEIELESQ